jgi:hypothetical protein
VKERKKERRKEGKKEEGQEEKVRKSEYMSTKLKRRTRGGEKD